MKRFDFRLERVLSVKRRLERLAEERQKQARAEFEAATAEAVEAQRRVEEEGAGGLEVVRKAATYGSLQARFERVAALERLACAARERAAASKERLRAANQARTRIASEVEVLDHLRERHAAVHRTQVAREQYEQLDEIGMRRWLKAANGEGEESTQEESR